MSLAVFIAAAAAPVPLKPTVCGEPAALSATLSDAANVPAAFGLNAIVMPHDALTARVDPQVWVCENDAAPVPVILMLEMFSVAVPVFVKLIAGAVFVDPTTVLLKVSKLAES